MASFFQPGSNDPAIAACPPSTFEVYCNSILPADQRFRKWYQLVTLIVGGVTLAVPLGVYLCQLGVLLCKSAIRSSTRCVRYISTILGRDLVADLQVGEESTGKMRPKMAKTPIDRRRCSNRPSRSESTQNPTGSQSMAHPENTISLCCHLQFPEVAPVERAHRCLQH